jgi:hypothetical protein
VVVVIRNEVTMLTISGNPIVIRRAYPDDAAALQRLGQLDSRRLKAALGLDSGAVAADPFHPSDPLVRLLHMHADLLHRREQKAKRAERRLRSLLPIGKSVRHAPAHR